MVVQADTRLWEQVGGEERLSPTRDVLVSPAVFTIPANGSQIVRVALRRPPDAERELSYRLILTEVPQQASPDFTGLERRAATQPPRLRRPGRGRAAAARLVRHPRGRWPPRACSA